MTQHNADTKQRRSEIWRQKIQTVAVPPIMINGIEDVPCAFSTTMFEIECIYCTDIISIGAAERTCARCATKWLNAFGPNWPGELWHQELIAQHKAFCNNRAHSVSDARELENGQPLSPVDPALLAVDAEYRETRNIVAAIREQNGWGSDRILAYLKEINKGRCECGAEALPIPSERTIDTWLSFYRTDDQQERKGRLMSEALELYNSGQRVSKIFKLFSARGEDVSLSTVRRWVVA